MKIAILTNFMEFNPGYSLTGIVTDQAAMLKARGHEVHVFVNEQYHGDPLNAGIPMHNVIPFAHLKDYSTINGLTAEHKMTIKATEAVLRKELVDFNVAFTHDFIFTGWFLPYGLACLNVSQSLPGLAWFHWIHSVPSAMRDWWNVKAYPPRHKLVYPNETDRLRVAEQYRGEIDNVRVIPHIKDPRSWYEFSAGTCELIDRMPGLLSADIVQVLPASTDRLSAKKVDVVMAIFGAIKKRNVSVSLVIANQWATGRQRKEDVRKYIEAGEAEGLVYGKDFLFTSEVKEEWATGIPRRMVRELFMLSNLFIFPTREESFGLVVPEAALSGVLPVLNKSLAMQTEVGGGPGRALFFDFGSFHSGFTPADSKVYFRDIATIILGRIWQDESIRAKTFARKTYNWDNLYPRYYEPIMMEAIAQCSDKTELKLNRSTESAISSF